MLWTTASVCLSSEAYWLGLRMSARSQVTLWDQGGGSGEAVTEDQIGAPERLGRFGMLDLMADMCRKNKVSKIKRNNYYRCVPNGSDIPATLNSGFTNSRPQEAIAATNDYFLDRCHIGLLLFGHVNCLKGSRIWTDIILKH
jgi:hypothetical protein